MPSGTTGVCLIGAMSPNITTGNVGSGRGVNAGFTLPLQGSFWALGTGGKLKQLVPLELQTYVSGISDSGGAAAVGTGQWETAAEPATTGGTLTFAIWGSAIAMTANGYFNAVGKLPTSAVYIRFRLTAYTSGYFSAYVALV